MTIPGTLRGPLRKRESNLWEREKNDWYVEPRWCSARLFEVEKFEGDVIDPACGMGSIPLLAANAGLNAAGTDVVQRWDEAALESQQVAGLRPTLAVGNFLDPEWPPLDSRVWARPENLVSNPPFGVAEAFVEKALRITECKVAMLLPAKWIQGQKRSRWLATTPLYRVWFICPRPSMPPRPCDRDRPQTRQRHHRLCLVRLAARLRGRPGGSMALPRQGGVMIGSIHRFVRFHQAEDYLRLGWLPLPSLRGTHHGDWSVHMAWLCDCPPIEPGMAS